MGGFPAKIDQSLVFPSVPQAKAWMQKPQGGGKLFVQIPEGAWGMIMDEIDTCVINEFAYRMLQKLIVNKLPNVRKQF